MEDFFFLFVYQLINLLINIYLLVTGIYIFHQVVSRGGFHVGNGINWKGQVFSKMRNHTVTNRMTVSPPLHLHLLQKYPVNKKKLKTHITRDTVFRNWIPIINMEGKSKSNYQHGR